jgi:hypothetical protein
MSAGVWNVTADEDGVFSATINLKTLNPPPEAGDFIDFDAVWIGPTRERLKAAATTKIQHNLYVVSVTTSVSDDKLVPMQEFSIVTNVEPKESLPANSSTTVRPTSPHIFPHCILCDWFRDTILAS